MDKMMEQILRSNKAKGLIEVDKLLADSGMYEVVYRNLQSMGYAIQDLSPRQISILFFALTDILFIVRDDSFYLATLSVNKIYELNFLGRLIPNKNTQSLINNNSQQTINKYLNKGRFHLIKLNQVESCSTFLTLVSLGAMNPYPSLDDDIVYCLSNVGNWYNELNSNLIRGSLKLITKNGFELCTSYLQDSRGVCTGGYLLTNDLSNNPKRIHIWEVLDYEPYHNNKFIQMLLSGVVSFDNVKLTLNREILEKYYGKYRCLKLETMNVRYRLCLEELLSSFNNYKVDYYIEKYSLDIYHCDTSDELIRELKSRVKVPKASDIISARVLADYNSIINKHVSYYHNINLNKLGEHSISLVENVKDVLPKKYRYYAICDGLGYNSVDVTATSDSLALKYGETEYRRKFGEPYHFCSLVCEGRLVKGFNTYLLGVDTQLNLCQGIMWGYSKNYSNYSILIKDICSMNNIAVTDDYIQFLFINKLARKYKYPGDIKLHFVILQLIEFMETIRVRVDAEKALIEELEKLVYPKVVKEYRKIEENPEKFSKISTTNGTYIETPNARYKLDKGNVLNKTVEFRFRGRFICKKLIKC